MSRDPKTRRLRRRAVIGEMSSDANRPNHRAVQVLERVGRADRPTDRLRERGQRHHMPPSIAPIPPDRGYLCPQEPTSNASGAASPAACVGARRTVVSTAWRFRYGAHAAAPADAVRDTRPPRRPGTRRLDRLGESLQPVHHRNPHVGRAAVFGPPHFTLIGGQYPGT